MVVEADEIAAGRTVIDEPVAVMKTWLKVASAFDEERDDEGLIFLWKNGECVCRGIKKDFGAHRVRFLTGKTTLLVARRQCGAFAPIRKLLLDHGVTAEEFLELGPSIFRGCTAYSQYSGADPTTEPLTCSSDSVKRESMIASSRSSDSPADSYIRTRGSKSCLETRSRRLRDQSRARKNRIRNR